MLVLRRVGVAVEGAASVAADVIDLAVGVDGVAEPHPRVRGEGTDRGPQVLRAVVAVARAEGDAQVAAVVLVRGGFLRAVVACDVPQVAARVRDERGERQEPDDAHLRDVADGYSVCSVSRCARYQDAFGKGIQRVSKGYRGVSGRLSRPPSLAMHSRRPRRGASRQPSRPTPPSDAARAGVQRNNVSARLSTSPAPLKESVADMIERDVEGTFTAVRFFRALTAAAVRTTCEFSVKFARYSHGDQLRFLIHAKQ